MHPCCSTSLSEFSVNFRYPRRGTDTQRGLEMIYKRVLPQARRRYPKVLIVMTDGRSRSSVNSYSRKLHKAGVAVYAIGIGRKYNKKQLQAMASSPKSKHVITVGFSRLGSMIKTIQGRACKGECPHYSFDKKQR